MVSFKIFMRKRLSLEKRGMGSITGISVKFINATLPALDFWSLRFYR